jgi:hypothetical protein
MSTLCAYCPSIFGPLSWFKGKPISVCQDCMKMNGIENKPTTLHYKTCKFEGCDMLVGKCDCGDPDGQHDQEYCWNCYLNLSYHFK